MLRRVDLFAGKDSSFEFLATTRSSTEIFTIPRMTTYRQTILGIFFIFFRVHASENFYPSGDVDRIQ